MINKERVFAFIMITVHFVQYNFAHKETVDAFRNISVFLSNTGS